MLLGVLAATIVEFHKVTHPLVSGCFGRPIQALAKLYQSGWPWQRWLGTKG